MARAGRWTENEEDFLINNWYKKGVSWCVKKLKRSYSNVFFKAGVLGLGGYIKDSGYLTGQNIADITGISKHTVRKWANAGLIKYKLAPNNQKVYLVKVSDLEQFLKNNQDLWDSRNFKASLWRTKPDWFKEKMQRDKLLPKLKITSEWDAQAIQTLLTMIESGNYTHKQIGEYLDKSPQAIKDKVRSLRRLRKAK